MADPLGNFVPEFIENEVEREAIVKLAKMITDRVPQKLGMKKITKYDPEYWGLSVHIADNPQYSGSYFVIRSTGDYLQCVQMRWQRSH